MSEQFQATDKQEPIKSRPNTRRTSYINRKGYLNRYQANTYLELRRFKEVRTSNPSEIEEVLCIAYSAATIKIHGNRAALDKILSLDNDGCLCAVKESESVDTERYEQYESSKEPVIYSIQVLVPKSADQKGSHK